MSPSPGLALARCFHHPRREAAARCPGCSRNFCRECVVEHDGRLLCTDCLARETSGGHRRRGRLEAMRRASLTVLGLALAWLAFYVLGEILLNLPDAVHGTRVPGP